MAALVDIMDREPEGSRIIAVFDATSPVRATLRYRRTHARRKINHFAGDMLDTLLQKAGKHEVVLLVWQRSHVGSPVNEWADSA
eukprot:3375010-Prymnesium_polylepis.1